MFIMKVSYIGNLLILLLVLIKYYYISAFEIHHIIIIYIEYISWKSNFIVITSNR